MAIIPRHLVSRDDSNSDVPMTPTIMNLLIALVILFAVGLLCIAILLILRSRRKTKQAQKFADFQSHRPISRVSHRRVPPMTAPINVCREKEILVDDGEKSPSSPVPEIRITFPEEDESGNKRASGRIVVVKIGDKGAVGLEPYNEEHLPPYHKGDERFQSLDLERMGGLKEKATPQP
ncbi:MAG: hypothetical protein Q9217_005403 [Psora testacea]